MCPERSQSATLWGGGHPTGHQSRTPGRSVHVVVNVKVTFNQTAEDRNTKYLSTSEKSMTRATVPNTKLIE